MNKIVSTRENRKNKEEVSGGLPLRRPFRKHCLSCRSWPSRATPNLQEAPVHDHAHTCPRKCEYAGNEDSIHYRISASIDIAPGFEVHMFLEMLLFIACIGSCRVVSTNSGTPMVSRSGLCSGFGVGGLGLMVPAATCSWKYFCCILEGHTWNSLCTFQSNSWNGRDSWKREATCWALMLIPMPCCSCSCWGLSCECLSDTF